MSVRRQWVRRLGLLLAAGMVVQVPGLVGIGVSGASAATASYTATVSIDNSTCLATLPPRGAGRSRNPSSLTWPI